jgi:hypothetical protein
MDYQTYLDMRSVWLDALENRVCGSIATRGYRDLDLLAPCERALVIMHIGIGHLAGAEDASIALDGALSEATVSKVISQVWRGAALDNAVAPAVLGVWVALFERGRDYGRISTHLLSMILGSPSGEFVQRQVSRVLAVNPSDDVLLRAVLRRPESIDSDFADSRSQWSVEGDHSRVIRVLLSHVSAGEGLILFAPLEVISAFPDDSSDYWYQSALSEASRRKYLYLTVENGWGGPSPSDIPPWVRDIITVHGARAYQVSAGLIPSWIMVAESEDELSAINRWSYGGGLGLVDSGRNALTILAGLEFGEGDRGTMPFSYSYDDIEHMNSLRVLLAVGILRVELYQLDKRNRLAFVASFGYRVAPEFCDQIQLILGERLGELSASGALEARPATPERYLLHMAQVERTFYETLHSCVPHLKSGSDLGESYARYLTAVDSVAKDKLRGSMGDERVVDEAFKELRTQISKSERKVTPLELDVLGSGRALVQFVATVDSDLYLRANVSYLDPGGDLLYESFEFSSSLELRRVRGPVSDLREDLMRGLAPLSHLREIGVTSLVVSCGAGIYNLPFHDALLGLGFDSVGYAHRIGVLQDSPIDFDLPGIYASANSGSGSQRLAAVAIETSGLKYIYPNVSEGDLPMVMPSIVHLAGHAQTGAFDYDVAIWATIDGEPLTSARVLLDLDLAETALVYLSACATAAGGSVAGELIGAVPLDVAFLEKGAGVVIGTCAPINDIVSGIFSLVFHYHISRGVPIYASYLSTRGVLQDTDSVASSSDLGRALGCMWPSWRDELTAVGAGARDDWRLVRVSGRFW